MFDLMESWETAEAARLLESSPACETQSHLETLCLSLESAVCYLSDLS